ncbi:UDP-2,4-diacetamido-2,4,6-trideoxy-beta-L-altropyranose hydrolase [Devosia sp. WQ 349]|uniref:UDP-2,4-diacetamido-2,4, 6-trideoxy-beta-L-altropyranose hydrolase n=1 Tax=Devosia sp. WQ 349K1 TaxID=2800329 RepID=UPI001904ABB1|nr:UDP-2,4-diacetamido-2,4,6-trideoxy-beta-L-altropyranose hydrolase [Devosia sp. WQ 349K1]MBK1796007.1 UDP-2,4-diacetamido-2,4,6-trideoxy-beta-L-altropyranose hydrolase [Devosia sp. WQ 349K1]
MTSRPRGTQRIAFRTDASIQIGTGHVMRCLTLADALVASGAECVFISREHEGNLNEIIRGRGHQVLSLPKAEPNYESFLTDGPAHQHWVGVSSELDAEQTVQAIGESVVDWLVVDHYALDARWEAALRGACRQLMVVDDLADRSHICDMLLDQSLGRRQDDYLDLTPPGCMLLVGPTYALLRPEFSALREESLARRGDGKLEHLLITMGGVDKDNVTAQVLEALGECYNWLPENLRITVIMGPHAPWCEMVRQLAMTMPRPTQVVVGVSDMARRMADADLAIGAAGSTSWERCCLGLPTVTLVQADNQKSAANSLKEQGAIWLVEGDDIISNLRDTLGSISQNLARMREVARMSSQIIDGLGCSRTIDKMFLVGDDHVC